MKIKYILVISLLMAILTLGAVSATDDVDTLAGDDSVDVVNAPDDVDIVAEEDDDGDGGEYEEDYSNLISMPSEAPYKTDKNITFKVDEDVSGTLYMSDGKEYDNDAEEDIFNYQTPVTNGKAVFSLKDFNIGYYGLKFKFVGDESASEKVVNKINYYFEDYWFGITILPFDMPRYHYVNEDLIVKLLIPEGYTGNLSVSESENLIKKVDISSGEINLGKFDLNYHRLTFVFDFDNFDYSEYSPDFEVIDVDHNVQLVLESSDILKGEDSRFKFVGLTSYIEGDMELYIEGNLVDSTFGTTELVFDSTNLDDGIHNYEIKFLGDDYFNPTSVSGQFNLSSVTYYIPETYDLAKNNDSLIIYLQDGATGHVTVKANGVVIYSDEFNYNQVSVDLNELKYGENDIEITITGNYPSVKKGKINVSYSLDFKEDYLVYGSQVVSLSIPYDASAEVTVVIEGQNYKAVRDNDEFIIKVPADLNIGMHQATIKYAGDAKYPKKDFETTLNVLAEILIDTDDNKDVVLVLPSDATGNLNIKVYKTDKGNRKIVVDKNISLENGKASYSFKDLPWGQYVIYAEYIGGDYDVISNRDFGSSFTIFPDLTYPSKMIEGGKDVISINLPGESGYLDIIAYSEDNEWTKSADLVNGKASIPLSMLPAGEIEIHVSIYLNYPNEDDDIYTDYFDSSITIFVQKPSIKASDAKVMYSANSLYKVQITGVDKNFIVGDKVTFKINGKVIGTGKIDKNGYASIKIKQNPGNYKITAQYHKTSVTKKLTVQHVLKLQKVKVKRIAKKLVIKATVAKVNGKFPKGNIVLKFNGKKFTAKINNKCVAKFTIKKKVLKKLKKGKKVKYQATYLKDTIKYTIKVK